MSLPLSIVVGLSVGVIVLGLVIFGTAIFFPKSVKQAGAAFSEFYPEGWRGRVGGEVDAMEREESDGAASDRDAVGRGEVEQLETDSGVDDGDEVSRTTTPTGEGGDDSGEEEDPSWAGLLDEGDYSGALETLQDDAPWHDREVNSTREQVMSFFYLHAIYSGTPNAYGDLVECYESNTGNVHVARMMIKAHLHFEEVDQALEVGESALDNLERDGDFTESQRVQFLGTFRKVLFRKRRLQEAVTLLSEQVAFVDGRRNLSDLYYYLSDAYERLPDSDAENVEAIRELALRYQPDNISRRLDHALRCSSDDVALGHYLNILDDERHSTSMNNAGVRAGNMYIKGKSIEFFKNASESGNTLASGNLAHNLISGGFYEMAESVIEEAKDEDNYSDRLESANWKLSENRAKEQDRINSIRNNFYTYTEVIQNYGEALIDEDIDYSNISGKYEKENFPFVVTDNTVEFEVKGDFIVMEYEGILGGEKIVRAEVSGRGMKISWKTDDDTFEGEQSGEGILVYEGGVLSGYYTTEEEGKSPLETLEEWRLVPVEG